MNFSRSLSRKCSLFILATVLSACLPIATEAAEIIDIGDRNQVFIDGRYLAATHSARIVACPPRKTNERCLSGGGLQAYGTILPVDGTFRGFNALSKDGANWRRVAYGTVPEPDDLVGRWGEDGGAWVPFVDPSAPPEERYKLFHAGIGIKASADGFDWHTIATLDGGLFPPESCYPRGMDSLNKCSYDTRLDKYVAYVRVNSPQGRAVGRSVSDDLTRFPMPEVVFEFDKKDPHFGGRGVIDFYMPAVVQYPHAQDAYYLFNSRYLHYKDSFLADDLSIYPRSGRNTGTIDMGLAASRDGINWHRYDRKPWIALGPEDGFDSKCMYMCAGMFTHGSEIWMYYVGYPTLHGGSEPASERIPTMSRVVLPKDRFTCVEADYTGGEFTTPPLRFDGKTLHLNIETSAVGLARVEIQDENGKPLPGYALDDCDRIHTTNSTDRVVTWRRGNADVSPLAKKPVRLRFDLQFGSKLYAFRFAGPNPAGAASVDE